MDTITPEEQFEQFTQTLVECSSKILAYSDDSINHLISQYWIMLSAFFHNEELHHLYNKNYLSQELVDRSKHLRGLIVSIPKELWNAQAFRTEAGWQLVMSEADTILKLLEKRPRIRTGSFAGLRDYLTRLQ